jgi:hypothetical protein
LNHAIWQVQNANCTGYTDFTDQPYGSTTYQSAFNPIYTTTVNPVSGSPVLVTAKGVLPKSGTERSFSRRIRAYEPIVTTILQPDAAEGKDAWVNNGYANNNYGVTKEFVIEGGTWTGNFLIEFDLSAIPAGVDILSAELVLDMQSVDSDPAAAFTVYRMIEPWAEGTGDYYNSGDGATWNKSDGITPWSWPAAYDGTNPIATTIVNPTYAGAHSWEIKSLVQGWVSGSYDNYGLTVNGNAQTHNAWTHSSDEGNVDKRPKLTIIYACECGGGASQVLALQPDGATGEDTHLSDSKIIENFGNDASVINSNKLNAKDRGVVRFDLSSIPAGAILDSAVLQMNLESIGSGTSGTAALHRITAEWQELQASWKNRISSTPWSTDGGDYDPLSEDTTAIDPAGGPVTWDVTGLAAAWRDSTYPNYGVIMLVSDGINNANFSSSDIATAALRPKLTLNYSCPCGVDCTPGGPPPIVLPDVLFVVGNATILGSKDDGRKTLIESWGYNVTLIDDGDLQANFDTAAAAADVVYISGTINGGTLADKLTGSTTGLVNEFNGKMDNFGFCSSTSMSVPSADTFTKTDPAHFITEPFSGNSVTVFTTALSMSVPDGTLAPDLHNVGEVTGQPALVTLDTGATRWDSNPVPARRVHLPYSAADASNLTVDGETILKRALDWASGAGGTGPGPGPTTVTLNSVADTWLDENNNSTNYGSDAQMRIGKDGGNNLYRSQVEFEFSSLPAGATVVSATLRLNVRISFGNKNRKTALHRVTADWDENTVTWASVGGGIFDPAQLAAPTFDNTTGWKEWIVPPGLIHEWIDGVTPNHGLLLDYLSAQKSNYSQFATKDHSDPSLHPQLVIEYTEP